MLSECSPHVLLKSFCFKSRSIPNTCEISALFESKWRSVIKDARPMDFLCLFNCFVFPDWFFHVADAVDSGLLFDGEAPPTLASSERFQYFILFGKVCVMVVSVLSVQTWWWWWWWDTPLRFDQKINKHLHSRASIPSWWALSLTSSAQSKRSKIHTSWF